MSSAWCAALPDRPAGMWTSTEAGPCRWTELHIAAPAANGGTAPAAVALHCYGLEVQAVTVNDMPASYDVLPSVR